jgi:cytochrome bd ubiquinol oxidase subunit II
VSALYSFGLPDVVAGLIVAALCAYAITGGADYGGGVWDLLASGPRREQQREHIARSLAPIWEANHVWLIVVVVMLFTAFPAAFSIITIWLHLPLLVVLLGIVARGSAFVFRSYGAATERERRNWGLVFSIASTITPVFLGICIGAIASGRVGEATQASAGQRMPMYTTVWLSSGFAISVGFFALALFAFLAAVYLAFGSAGQLREDFRRRALSAAAVVFVMAAIALAASHMDAERVAFGITRTPIGIAVQVSTGAFAILAIWSLWRRRFAVARVAAAAQTICIIWGWALAQFPFIIPEELRIRDAAAPRETLVLLVIGLGVGTAILVPALRYLFRLFATATSSR